MFNFLRKNWWRFSPDQLLEKIEVHTFDRRHGTETSAFAELRHLDIASENRHHGERYQPSPVHSLRRLLKHLNIRYADFSFVDFGSGKGRTLLIAGEFPFRQVIGVEFSAALNARAQQNIERYSHRAAARVHSEHADATQFELPPDDLVLYFFNPFGHHVLDQVLANIRASLRNQPRKVILIYLYLLDEAWLLAQGDFRLRENWRNYQIFDHVA